MTTQMTPPSGARRGPSALFVWVIAALVLVGLAELFAHNRLQERAARRKHVMTTVSARPFTLVLPDSLPMVFVHTDSLQIEQRSLALSPDADKLVYVSWNRAATRLVCMDLYGVAVRVLAGTEGGFNPAFSPDGHWLAFQTETALKKIALDGGRPVVLTSMREPGGVQWIDPDHLIAAERMGQSLVRVRADGTRLDTIASTHDLYLHPTITPDGSSVLYANFGSASVMELATHMDRVLTRNGTQPYASAPRWERFWAEYPKLLPSGQLLYCVEELIGARLRAMPVTNGTYEPLGRPVELATNVRVGPAGVPAQYDTANDMLVYAKAAPLNTTGDKRTHPGGGGKSRVEDPSADLTWMLYVVLDLPGVIRAAEMAKR